MRRVPFICLFYLFLGCLFRGEDGMGLSHFLLEVPKQHYAMESDLQVTVHRNLGRNASTSATTNDSHWPDDIPFGNHTSPLSLTLYRLPKERSLKTFSVGEILLQESFVVPCGVILEAGEYIFRLQQGNLSLEVSETIRVLWPSVIIDVPSRLETYRSPAEFVFRFSRRKCAPQPPFEVGAWAELLYHGNPSPRHQSSQDFRRRRESEKSHPWSWTDGFLVLGKVLIPKLYSRVSHVTRFECRFIGPAGILSTRLITAEEESGVGSLIASSSPFDSIIPCAGSIAVVYSYPVCTGNEDKIRLFARYRANVTSANPPIVERYITEKRVVNQSTIFHCSIFDESAVEYCFAYVNVASTKSVSEVCRYCVSTYKPKVIRDKGNWASWSKWSACTASCEKGKRIRYRLCDNPPPRNGGEFCKGPSLDMSECESVPCESLTSQKDVLAALYPIMEDLCTCGCKIRLDSSHTVISSSALECTGTSNWILQAPNNHSVLLEVSQLALMSGAQWLKIRDGNTSSSALLATFPVDDSDKDGGPPIQVISSNKFLFVEFFSDINNTDFSNPTKLFGFSVTVWTTGMYYCYRYPIYKKSKLIVDSPIETPTSSPRRFAAEVLVHKAVSSQTLSEILSLKSLRVSGRRDSSSSYSRLSNERKAKKRNCNSVPASPLITRKNLVLLRKSSGHINRFLQNKSTKSYELKRRSASFDDFTVRAISPILEDVSTASVQCLSKSKDEKLIDNNKSSEDYSEKYREHRKSLQGDENLKREKSQEFVKLLKDKENMERLRKNVLSRSSLSTVVRPDSSASELSGNGNEEELEYDYYDYDVDNASAVPGSVFGMDPTLLPWLPPFVTFAERQDDDAEVTLFCRSQENIELHKLNMQPSTDLLKQSLISDSSNDLTNESDRTPVAELNPLIQCLSNDSDSASHSETKLQNVQDFNDFQFADETDEESV